jgi:hypothetical protein
MKQAKWKWRYSWQLASYIVYCGGQRLRDFYPSRDAAIIAVRHLNNGGSAENIPDA